MNPVKVDLICLCGSPVTIYYLNHAVQVITVRCKCGETLTWRRRRLLDPIDNA